MKLSSSRGERGSVLLTAFLTITILTVICATSLYVTSQNQNAGMQTASWQQALSSAEMGVDTAVRALNTGTWGGQWLTQNYTGSLQTSPPPYGSPQPTPMTATAAPSAGKYNYQYLGDKDTPYLIMAGASPTASPALTPTEGNTKMWGWVTVDTAGMSVDSNGNQWYRVRSTGVAATNGLFRASSNRLDNDLRNTIGLRFDRKTATQAATPAATRSIEVIMQPITMSIWARGISLKASINMSGGSFVDSFDPTNPFKSTNGLYDITKRQSHGSVATTNSTSSDLKSTYIYGDLSYSGPAVKNTTHVQGTISTPYSATTPTTSAPTWASGTYTSVAAGNPGTLTATGQTSSSPNRYKVNGNLTIPGGNVLNINSNNSGSNTRYIEIWVTGNFTTSGSGYVLQDSNVVATIYVGGDITVSGQSFNNQSGRAKNVNFVGYGGANSNVTISGSGTFIGTILAPNYDVTISGSAGYSGAVIANSMNLSGSGGFHYDESLASNGTSTAVGNYAFASWFEDNSDPTRKDINLNPIIY